jgi:Tfp pilus assembly protein PilX
LAAALAFVVCGAGFAGGRILAMVQGAKPGAYTGIVLALEVAIIVAASAAYISEKTRISREAKEQKRAEKAALEAALAAEHAERAAALPPATIQQP